MNIMYMYFTIKFLSPLLSITTELFITTEIMLSTTTELLVQTVFKPGSTINPDHKDKYLHILAYAASVYDSATSSEPHKEELESTKKAIESAHMICSRASASHAELQVEIPTLFDVVKHPIVSVGVLRWVEHTLTDPTFFEEAAKGSALFFVLLCEVRKVKFCCINYFCFQINFFFFRFLQIALCHTLQHAFILELLKRLIERSYPMLEVSVQVSTCTCISMQPVYCSKIHVLTSIAT